MHQDLRSAQVLALFSLELALPLFVSELTLATLFIRTGTGTLFIGTFSWRKWLKLLTLLVSVALTDAGKATDTDWASIIAPTLIVRHSSVILCWSSTAVGHVIIYLFLHLWPHRSCGGECRYSESWQAASPAWWWCKHTLLTPWTSWNLCEEHWWDVWPNTSCQPPNDSTTMGRKAIPCLLQASPAPRTLFP